MRLPFDRSIRQIPMPGGKAVRYLENVLLTSHEFYGAGSNQCLEDAIEVERVAAPDVDIKEIDSRLDALEGLHSEQT